MKAVPCWQRPGALLKRRRHRGESRPAELLDLPALLVGRDEEADAAGVSGRELLHRGRLRLKRGGPRRGLVEQQRPEVVGALGGGQLRPGDVAVHADKEQLTDALGEGQVPEHLRDARGGG